MKRTIVTALAVAALVALWLLSGQFGDDDPSGGAQANTDATKGVSVSADLTDVQSIPVRGRVFTSRLHATVSVIRGRTEAFRTVALRSQTAGYVQSLPFAQGNRVSGGEAVCKLDIDARGADLDEARALLRSRQLEYEAAADLAKKGHRSETQTAAARAALDAARAMVKRAQIELSHTEITAPFEEIIEELPVEIGDYIAKGAICAHIVDDDPMLVIGQVSEQEVGKFAVGDAGKARLITGEEVKGKIRFVGSSADRETRTFRVELEVPNPDHLLRDGVTAEIRVMSAPKEAHLISPALITLNDEGVIGIRIVDQESIVRFVPIEIIADSPDGMWITGPPKQATIITVGHEYVVDGLPVKLQIEQAAGTGSTS